MCGLVGLVSTEGTKGAYKRKELFTQLLFVDTLRGKHGTGLATICPSKKPKQDWDLYMFKKPMTGPDLIQLDYYDSMMDTVQDAYVVMGHNRAKTHGDAIEKHTHPFCHGSIVLAHNGTLSTKGGLEDYDLRVRNDSSNIAFNMDLMGEDKALAALDGSYALTWFNLEDGTFNFARNEDRPLFYAKIKDENTLIYASEIAMLKAIAHRNDVALEPVYYPTPHTHIKFSFPEFTKPAITKFEKWVWKYSGGSSSSGYPRMTPHSSFGLGADEDVNDWKSDGRRHSSSSKHTGAKPHLKELYEAGFRPDEEEIMTFTHFKAYKDGKSKKGSVWGVIYRNDKAFSTQIINQDLNFYNRESKAHAYHKIEICSLQLQEEKPVIICRWVGGIVPGENVSLKKGKSTDLVTVPEPKNKVPESSTLPSVLANQFVTRVPDDSMREGFCHGPGSSQVPISYYRNLTADGCAGCSDKAAVAPEKDDEVLWSIGRKPICKSCYSDPKMLEALGYPQTNVGPTADEIAELALM